MAGIQKLRIEQQLAEIGLNVTPAKMQIEIPRMKMKIKSEIPRMQIERKAPSFKVNRRKINNESGLKAPLEFSREYRDKGLSDVLKGAKTAGEDGDFLGDARIRGDRISKLARNKAMASAMKKKKLELELMPQSSPEVEWDKGYMRINWSKHSIVIDWDGEYMPQLTIDPKYSIEIFLRTEPYFKVTVEEMVNPNSPGRYVDQAI